MSRRWQIFWVIWLACFLPVAWSLRSGDGESLSGRKAIAKVESIQGKVTVRTESHMTWQTVKANQQLFSNDLISTEDKSRVSIVFTNGRKLQLTPGSVVKLSLPSPLSKDTQVDVLKGRFVLKAEDPKAKEDSEDSRMIIQKGNEKFVASPKPIEVDTKEERVKANIPPTSVAAAAVAAVEDKTKVSLEALRNLNLNDSVKLSALAPPPVIIKEKCEPPPEPELKEDDVKAEEKALIPSFEARLLPQIAPTSGEFWTAEPLKKVTDKALKLEVDIPSNLPKNVRESWKGIVNISGPEGHIRVDGKAASGKKRLSVTLKDLMAAKVIRDLSQASFAVNAGYSIESEAFSEAIEHNSPTTGVYSMRSLAEGEGIMVGFDKLQTNSTGNSWLLVNPQTSNRIWIGVTEAEDRRKLFELVQGNNGQVSRTDWPGIPAQGTYIVRGDKIVGIINGQNISKAEWDKIRQLFRADLIFRGAGTSFLSRSTFDASKINDRTLYVLNRGQFAEIDVSLLRSRPKSMSFVMGVSSFIFREQPQILSMAN